MLAYCTPGGHACQPFFASFFEYFWSPSVFSRFLRFSLFFNSNTRKNSDKTSPGAPRRGLYASFRFGVHAERVQGLLVRLRDNHVNRFAVLRAEHRVFPAARVYRVRFADGEARDELRLPALRGQPLDIRRGNRSMWAAGLAVIACARVPSARRYVRVSTSHSFPPI